MRSYLKIEIFLGTDLDYSREDDKTHACDIYESIIYYV